MSSIMSQRAQGNKRLIVISLLNQLRSCLNFVVVVVVVVVVCCCYCCCC